MPQLSTITYQDGTQIYGWEVTECIAELMAMCASAGIDVAECERFGADSRKVEYMVERLLLAAIFGKVVELKHNADGAPFIDYCRYVSISHTKGYVCVAVNDHRAIGVDVELKSGRVLRVRSKFLDDDEQQRIDDRDIDGNLVAWTAKEAMYKVASHAGVGLAEHLHTGAFAVDADGCAEYDGRCDHPEAACRMKMITHVARDKVITLASIRQK